MNLPNLPTDSLYKFIALLGLGAIIYSFVAIREKGGEVDRFERIAESSTAAWDRAVRTMYGQTVSDTLETARANRDIDAFVTRVGRTFDAVTSMRNKMKSDSSKGNTISKSQAQADKKIADSLENILEENSKETTSKKNSFSAQFQAQNSRWDSLNAKTDSLEKIASSDRTTLNDAFRDYQIQISVWTLIRIIAFISFFIGGYKWIKTQQQQDILIEDQARKARPVCQSCGMNLRFDSQKSNHPDYCSHCVDESGFTQLIKLDEFKSEINTRLIQLGYSWLRRRLYLDNLASLDRWRQEFKWSDFYVVKKAEIVEGGSEKT